MQLVVTVGAIYGSPWCNLRIPSTAQHDVRYLGGVKGEREDHEMPRTYLGYQSTREAERYGCRRIPGTLLKQSGTCTLQLATVP